MAYSYNETTAPSAGYDTYAYTFPVLDVADIKVRLEGAELTSGQYTATLSPSQVVIDTAEVTISAGDVIRVWRDTPATALVDFQDGTVLREADLDKAILQPLYRSLESYDRAQDMLPTGGAAGSVLRKTTATDYDVQWDDALNASVAQVISANGTDAWSGNEAVTWNATPRVNQESIISVATDTPTAGVGNCIQFDTAGDYEYQVDVSAEHTTSADDDMSLAFYFKAVGGAWVTLAATYLPKASVAGVTAGQAVGTITLLAINAGDQVAVVAAPGAAAGNWSWSDKGSQCMIRRIA